MRDKIGRNVHYLRLSVTDRCNYRCEYCMPAGDVPEHRHEPPLSAGPLTEICRAAVACGVDKIRLTGGEPLVRRDIVELCRQIRRIDGLRELTLTTNGALLPELAGPLKDAGVDRLNISLDTLRPDRFARITRTGALARTLSGLEAAARAGFVHTKLNVVLIGGFNLDEIPDFVALTRDRDLTVRFIELMPIGPCAGWDEACFVPADAVLDAVPRLEPCGAKGVCTLYRVPGWAGRVGLILPMSQKFCSDCNRIRVTADGRLKPCLHSDEEISLRALEGQALIDAIRDAIYRKPAQHSLSEAGCSGSHRRMHEIGG